MFFNLSTSQPCKGDRLEFSKTCKHQYKARRDGMVLSGTWEGLPLRGKKHRNPEEIWQKPVI